MSKATRKSGFIQWAVFRKNKWTGKLCPVTVVKDLKIAKFYGVAGDILQKVKLVPMKSVKFMIVTDEIQGRKKLKYVNGLKRVN